jgi:hypothetical protein
MNQEIKLDAFKKRIITLLVRSGLTDLPKSPQDRQILFKSAILNMKPGEKLSESQVNEALGFWLANVAGLSALDHVSLRRALVDWGYLERSSDGTTYVLSDSGPQGWSFDPAIDDLDLETELEIAREEIEARKRAYLANVKEKRDKK